MHESENKNEKINNGEISDANTMSSNHIINKTSMKLLLIINIRRVLLKLFIGIVPSEFLR
jgi:hypothetical protein